MERSVKKMSEFRYTTRLQAGVFLNLFDLGYSWKLKNGARETAERCACVVAFLFVSLLLAH